MAYLKEEIKAGLIILSSIIILGGFVVLTGGSSFFEKFDTYYVKVKNSAGLEEGAQVKLGGVRVGRVLQIKAPDVPNGPVLIKIGLKEKTVLYKGTQAMITQVGLVGDIYLLLSVDNTTGGRIKTGEVIPSEEQVQFSALMAKVNDMSRSVDILMKDIGTVFSRKNSENIGKLIEDTDKAVTSGSSNLKQMVLALKASNDKLEHVLSEVEDMMKGNKGEVSQLILKAKEGIGKAGDMMKAIEETASSVGKTTKSVDKTVTQQAQNLENLMTTLQKTTEDMQAILQEIKHKPWSIMYKEKDGKEE